MPVSHAYFEGTLAPFERRSDLAETLTLHQFKFARCSEARGRRWLSRFVVLVYDSVKLNPTDCCCRARYGRSGERSSLRTCLGQSTGACSVTCLVSQKCCDAFLCVCVCLCVCASSDKMSKLASQELPSSIIIIIILFTVSPPAARRSPSQPSLQTHQQQCHRHLHHHHHHTDFCTAQMGIVCSS